MAEIEKRRSFVREAELDRVASQERLDVLNDVTTPPYWILLSIIFGLLLVAVLWGFFGSLPVKVAGEGILIQGGEVRAVTAPDPGMIEELLVFPGEMVKLEQPVARLNRNQVSRDLAQCQREAELAKPEEEGIIQKLNRQLMDLQQRERDVKVLVLKGRMPRRVLQDIQGQVTAIMGEIQARSQKIRALKTNCERLEAMAKEDTVILSFAAGRVIDVFVRNGDTVSAGAPILTLEPPGRVEATVFIPVRDGKRVKIGMPAFLSPSHIRPEEDGYLMARVASVTTYPATPEALKKVLRDEGLVNRLLEQGPLYRIGLRLEEDKGSPNGFRWTGKGSEQPIESGTVAGASVVIERRRPASYVIPILKKAVGAG